MLGIMVRSSQHYSEKSVELEAHRGWGGTMHEVWTDHCIARQLGKEGIGRLCLNL